MNTTKLSWLLSAALLCGCTTSMDFKKSAPLTSAPVSAEGRLQCGVYHLPEMTDTPKPPTIDLSSTSKLSPTAQKTALVVYIDQLRTYIGDLKRSVNASYMRYLVGCID